MKEYLSKRLNEIETSLQHVTSQIEYLKGQYNALIGRRDEINYLLSLKDYNVEPMVEDNAVDEYDVCNPEIDKVA